MSEYKQYPVLAGDLKDFRYHTSQKNEPSYLAGKLSIFSESIFALLLNPSKLAKDMAYVSDAELNKDHRSLLTRKMKNEIELNNGISIDY